MTMDSKSVEDVVHRFHGSAFGVRLSRFLNVAVTRGDCCNDCEGDLGSNLERYIEGQTKQWYGEVTRQVYEAAGR